MAATADPLSGLVEFVLGQQAHCDHYLTPFVAPAGKSVLVAGCGSGADLVWCLRRGARSVVGVDQNEQDPRVVERALGRCGGAQGSFELRRLDIRELDALEDRFDLVLANNVVEHVAELAAALAAMASVLAPGGRLAVFSSPFFYSSCGSHLEHEPWAHLWQEPEALRREILAAGRSDAGALDALDRVSLDDYFDRAIRLNRLRVADYLAAIGAAGLVATRLELVPDRNLERLPHYLPRLAQRLASGITTFDLGVEGIAMELAPAADAGAQPRD